MILDTYQNFFINIIFGFLFISLICYWISFVFKEFQICYIAARINSYIANIILVVFLMNRWINHGYFPLSNLYESLLFLSCILLFIHQIIEYKIQSKLLGAILLPIILFINGFSSLTLPIEMQKASSLVPALQSNWLMMHVSLMMLSYATLILGSLLSILFSLIFVTAPKDLSKLVKPWERPFKTNSFERLYELTDIDRYELPQQDFLTRGKFTASSDSFFEISPGLQTAIPNYDWRYEFSRSFSVIFRIRLLHKIDIWSYRIISLGFPFLTIGIIAGAVWANEAWGSYWSWDPKETWALITWLIFAAYLHIRLIKGWHGKRPAFLASIGFFVVWICYLGVNFLGQGLHSYGWLS